MSSKFKSLNSEVETVDRISDIMGEAILHQSIFKYKILVCEMASFSRTFKEFDSFKINLERIDRLYDINYVRSGGLTAFYLLVRMQYEQCQHVFVEMLASCDYRGPGYRGTVFITRNAHILSMIAMRYLTMDEEIGALYKSLSEDGYTLHHNTKPCNKTGPCTLMYLCHQSIYNNNEKPVVHYYLKVLPKTLKDSVQKFIHTEKAIIDYKEKRMIVIPADIRLSGSIK